MDIDAIIANSQESVEAQPETKAEITAEVESNPEPEKPEQETAKDKPDEAALAKKLSKQDRRIGRMTAEKYQLKASNDQLLSRIEALQQELSKLKAPKESDFEGKPYESLLEAKAEYAAEKKLIEKETRGLETLRDETNKAWKEERAQHLDDNGVEAAKVFADFHDVMSQSNRAMASLPAKIKDVFLEADNGAFALYALAKEGMLEDLADMSPARAAMIVAKMEDKGLALSKPKEVSKAPAPITSVKGTGTGGKSIEQMSGKELLRLARNS